MIYHLQFNITRVKKKKTSMVLNVFFSIDSLYMYKGYVSNYKLENYRHLNIHVYFYFPIGIYDYFENGFLIIPFYF